MNRVLNDEMLHKMDEYFRAANYLSAGQLYLLDNPLLKRKLTFDDIKNQLNGKLESYKLPVHYEWIDEIPKTQNGKIQRGLLK